MRENVSKIVNSAIDFLNYKNFIQIKSRWVERKINKNYKNYKYNPIFDINWLCMNIFRYLYLHMLSLTRCFCMQSKFHISLNCIRMNILNGCKGCELPKIDYISISKVSYSTHSKNSIYLKSTFLSYFFLVAQILWKIWKINCRDWNKWKANFRKYLSPLKKW